MNDKPTLLEPEITSCTVCSKRFGYSRIHLFLCSDCAAELQKALAESLK